MSEEERSDGPDGTEGPAPADDAARPSGDRPPDVRSIMAEIRARITARLEGEGVHGFRFEPAAAELSAGGDRRAGELGASEDLLFLNRGYSTADALPRTFVSHRRGPAGRIVEKLKTRFFAAVAEWLRPYLDAERDYKVHAVRYLNDVARYVDSRDASVFWELVRKIDVDVSRALERVDRAADEASSAVRASEARCIAAVHEHLGALRATAAAQGALLAETDRVVRGLEAAVARLPVPATGPGKGAAAGGEAGGRDVDDGDPEEGGASSSPGHSYLLLENRFRGSEAEVAATLAHYPGLLSPGASGGLPVLEIGAGRGELQLLLREAGVPAYGVDLDPAMAAAARESGADVRDGDGIAHLASLPDRSLGGLVAVQVVEHLPDSDLSRLLSLAASKVCPGGRVIFETVNPTSLLALSSNYFRDPTHVFPVHPDTLAYRMGLAGLVVTETKFLSPVPDEARLRPVTVREFMSPKFLSLVEEVNEAFARLNDLLYGYQDYCVVAEAR